MNLGSIVNKFTPGISPIKKVTSNFKHLSGKEKLIGLVTLPTLGPGLLLKKKVAKPDLTGTIRSRPNTAGLDRTKSAYVAGNNTGYSDPRNQVKHNRLDNFKPKSHKNPKFDKNPFFTNKVIPSNINTDNDLSDIL